MIDYVRKTLSKAIILCMMDSSSKCCFSVKEICQKAPQILLELVLAMKMKYMYLSFCSIRRNIPGLFIKITASDLDFCLFNDYVSRVQPPWENKFGLRLSVT